MKTLISALTIVCGMGAGSASVAIAQEKPATPKPAATAGMDDKKTAKPGADSAFMRTAAMDGMAEVDHGRLAVQNAESSDVKQFAQRMVDDHGKANSELKSLASQKSVTLPIELDAKHKAMHDKLSKLSGAGFDKAYMSHMVTAHKEAVALFEREAKNGTDAEAKSFAEKTLPTLREHLKMAQDVSQRANKK